MNGLLYMALIWSAKVLLYSPAAGYLCSFRFTHSSTQTKLYIVGYSFDGCYFGAFVGSAKIEKNEMPVKTTSYKVNLCLQQMLTLSHWSRMSCIVMSFSVHSLMACSKGLTNGDPIMVCALMMWSSSNIWISSTDDRILIPYNKKCLIQSHILSAVWLGIGTDRVLSSQEQGSHLDSQTQDFWQNDTQLKVVRFSVVKENI